MVENEGDVWQVASVVKIHLERLKETGMMYIPKNNMNRNLSVSENSDKRKEKLDVLKQSLLNCSKCQLCEHRTNMVFGVGDPHAKIVFVGEGPGRDEDLQGEPFVGRAGQLLDKMIQAMGLSREQCYICNVVKCRPPENRDPKPEEIEACEPFLKEQLNLIKPRVIVGLGRYACQTLLKSETPMSKLRGIWHDYEGITFMPTFHPAYLLRNPPAKKYVWHDLQLVMSFLKEQVEQ